MVLARPGTGRALDDARYHLSTCQHGGAPCGLHDPGESGEKIGKSEKRMTRSSRQHLIYPRERETPLLTMVQPQVEPSGGVSAPPCARSLKSADFMARHLCQAEILSFSTSENRNHCSRGRTVARQRDSFGGWVWRTGVVLGRPRALALGLFVRILPDQGNVVVSS